MLRDIAPPLPKIKQDVNGILLFYDNSRSKFLSISREVLTFGIDHNNINNSRWMMTTGTVNSNIVGYKIPRNATITSLTIQTKNLVTNCSFDILKNNLPSVETSISLTNESSKSIDNIDIPLNTNDWIQAILNITSGSVDYPILSIELAWR